MQLRRLHLIDGHSLTFKAYYGVRGLTSPSGHPTGAVYGFLRMLLKFIKEQQPEHLAIVFDTGRKTFRTEIYPEYKANRDAAPEDFGQQIAWIFELLEAMGIATYSLENYEADDLLATMAEQTKQGGGEAYILTADKDLFQLVDDHVHLLRPGRDELEHYDADGVVDKIGVKPEQVIDWLALVGDSSDNIPGVQGIGPKTAQKLLADYGSIDGIYEHLEEIKRPKQRESLENSRETVALAQRLATIVRDVPFEWTPEACKLPQDLWTPGSVQLMAELGFDSILSELAIDVPEIELEGKPSASPKIETDYRSVIDEKTLKAWLKKAQKAPWVALDTETTSTDVFDATLVGISLSCAPGEAIYLPVGHADGFAPPPQLALDDVRKLLAPLLEDEKGPGLCGHHAKYDWKILVRAGFSPKPPAFDTMIASYLLNPDKQSGHGLKALGGEICGVKMDPISNLIGKGRDQITMAEVAIEDAMPYACQDADITLRLLEYFLPKLEASENLKRVMDEIEMPLVPVLMAMELGGFKVDVDHLKQLSAMMTERLSKLTGQIWEEAGHEFNIGSTKQVATVLYDELKLPTGKKGKTGYSTNVAELERLSKDHEIARLILEFRGYEKLKSTYADALPDLVKAENGRIHTSFNQTIAATGRLSSTEPNLQNIPIRSDMGKAIRKAFIADELDHEVLKADYSQIELRILAHVTADPALRAAYEQGRDIHAQTAAQLFGVEEADVTRQMRSQAKTVNFGIMYGISAHGLSMQLGTSRQEAKEFIDRYFATYPGVQQWIDRLLTQARKDGYVETLLGRRRLVPELNSKNGLQRAGAERVAVNTPIQGTCADMIKLAMLRIHRELTEYAPQARMICQVHDELVFSVPRGQLEAAGGFIRQAMIEAWPLDVPVEVEIGHGPNWAECQADG